METASTNSSILWVLLLIFCTSQNVSRLTTYAAWESKHTYQFWQQHLIYTKCTAGKKMLTATIQTVCYFKRYTIYQFNACWLRKFKLISSLCSNVCSPDQIVSLFCMTSKGWFLSLQIQFTNPYEISESDEIWKSWWHHSTSDFRFTTFMY